MSLRDQQATSLSSQRCDSVGTDAPDFSKFNVMDIGSIDTDVSVYSRLLRAVNGMMLDHVAPGVVPDAIKGPNFEARQKAQEYLLVAVERCLRCLRRLRPVHKEDEALRWYGELDRIMRGEDLALGSDSVPAFEVWETEVRRALVAKTNLEFWFKQKESVELIASNFWEPLSTEEVEYLKTYPQELRTYVLSMEIEITKVCARQRQVLKGKVAQHTGKTPKTKPGCCRTYGFYSIDDVSLDKLDSLIKEFEDLSAGSDASQAKPSAIVRKPTRTHSLGDLSLGSSAVIHESKEPTAPRISGDSESYISAPSKSNYGWYPQLLFSFWTMCYYFIWGAHKDPEHRKLHLTITVIGGVVSSLLKLMTDPIVGMSRCNEADCFQQVRMETGLALLDWKNVVFVYVIAGLAATVLCDSKITSRHYFDVLRGAFFFGFIQRNIPWFLFPHVVAGPPSPQHSYSWIITVAISLVFVAMTLWLDPPKVKGFNSWRKRIARKLEILLNDKDAEVAYPPPDPIKLREAIRFAEMEAKRCAQAHPDVLYGVSEDPLTFTAAEAILATLPPWIRDELGASNVRTVQMMLNYATAFATGPTWKECKVHGGVPRYLAHYWATVALVSQAFVSTSITQFILSELLQIRVVRGENGKVDVFYDRPKPHSTTQGATYDASVPVAPVQRMEPNELSAPIYGPMPKVEIPERLQFVNPYSSIPPTVPNFVCTEYTDPIPDLCNPVCDFHDAHEEEVIAYSEDDDLLLGQYPSWLLEIEKISSFPGSVSHSWTLHHLEILLSGMAMAPWSNLIGKKIDDDLKDMPEEEKREAKKSTILGMMRDSLRDVKEGMNATERMISSMLFFAKYAHNLYVTGGKFLTVYHFMEGNSGDAIWMDAYKKHGMLVSGSYAQEGVKLIDIKRTFDQCELSLKNQLRCSSGILKMHVLKQMEKLTDWQNKYNSYCRQGAPKPEPFTMTLSGPPGIGKSHSTNYLINYLETVLEIENPKTGEINEADKYDTGLDSSVTTILWDDIGNTRPEFSSKDNTIAARMIRVVNSIVTVWTDAAVEAKGNKFNFAQLVIFTTNNPAVNAPHQNYTPEAIFRRLGLKIECTVKPEYLLQGSKEVLDRTKIKNPERFGLPEQLQFRQFGLDSAGNKFYIGEMMDDRALLALVRDKALEHKAFQDKRCLVRVTQKMTLCPHHLPKHSCDKCSPIPTSTPESENEAVEIGFWKFQALRLVDSVYSAILYALNIPDYDRVLNYVDSWKYSRIIKVWILLFFWVLPFLFSERVPIFATYTNLRAWDVCVEASPTFLYGFLLGCRSIPITQTVRNWNVFYLHFSHGFATALLGIVTLCLFLSMRLLADVLVTPLRILKKFSTLPSGTFMTGYAEAKVVHTQGVKHKLVAYFLGSSAVLAVLHRLMAPRVDVETNVTINVSDSCLDGRTLKEVLADNGSSPEEKVMASRKLSQVVAKLKAEIEELTKLPGFVNIPVSEGGSGVLSIVEPHALEYRKSAVTAEDVHSWQLPVHIGGAPQTRSSTMTLDQAHNVLRNNRCLFTFPARTSSAIVQVVGMVMEDGFVLFPDHVFKSDNGYYDSLTGFLTFWKGGQRQDLPYTIELGCTQKVEGTDLRLCICNCGSPFTRITHLLPSTLAPDGASVVAEFNLVSREDLSTQPTQVHMSRQPVATTKGGQFEAWTYKLPYDTENGMCMSYCLREHKGVVLECFHVGGTKYLRDGIGAILTSTLYESTLTALLHNNPTSIRTTQATTVNAHNALSGVTKEVSDEPHPKSLALHIPEGFVLQTYGEVLRTSRKARHTYSRSPNLQAALDAFKFPIFYGLPILNQDKEFRKAAIVGCTMNAPSPPAHLLREAFNDYVSVIALAVENYKKLPYARCKPLSFDDILTGIPDNPYCSAIKVNKSAGWPFGVKKARILEYDELSERWYMPPEVYGQLLAIEAQVVGNRIHSGLPFNATLKSEPRLLTKCDKARVFFAVSFYTYMLVQRYLFEAVVVINTNPELFETSLGKDRLATDWQKHLGDLLRFDPNRCIATDFSTYDQSQSSDLRKACANVFVSINRALGYSEMELRCTAYVANEFLQPILNLGSCLVYGTTTQPSGNNLTAHTNGIGTSLLARASFIKRHGLGANTFRQLVAMRTLGDDNIMTVSSDVDDTKWNALIFAEDCSEWGLQVTASVKDAELKKFSNLYDEPYLRSRLWYNRDLGCLIGALDPASIFKPLQFYEPSGTCSLAEQTMDILRGVVRESFFYGRDAYNWACSQGADFVRRIGLPEFDYLFVSYDDRVKALREDVGHLEDHPIPRGAPLVPPYYKFWEGEWPEVAGSEAGESSGITEFALEEINQGSVANQGIDISPLDEGEAPFARFFAREVRVGSFYVPMGEHFTRDINPYEALFSDPDFQDKMRRWAVAKTDVELKFVGSSNKGHAGILQLSYMPLPGSNIIQDESFLDFNVMQSMRSQRKCVYWDVSVEGGATVLVPFHWQYAALWLKKSSFSNLAIVSVNSLTPLMQVSESTQPLQVTVYAKLKNFVLSGATGIDIGSEAEPFSSIASSVADMAKLTASYLAFAPQLAMVTDYAAMTLEGIAGVARYFGHSRPMMTANFESIYTSPPLATGNDNLNGRTLALDRDQSVSMSSHVNGIVEADGLVFENMFNKPNVLGVILWDSSMKAGESLMTLVNSCCHGTYGTGNFTLVPTTYALVTANFASAHWTNRYRLTVVTPPFNAGVLQLTYEPTGIPVSRSTVRNRSFICDIQTQNVIDITCHWQQPTSLRTTHHGAFQNPFGNYDATTMNGALELSVESPLAPFSATRQTAYIIVEGWIENVRLGNYAPMDLSGYGIALTTRQYSGSRVLTRGPLKSKQVVVMGPGTPTFQSHDPNAHDRRAGAASPSQDRVPTSMPSRKPSPLPSAKPSTPSTTRPTGKPSDLPTDVPTVPPTGKPTVSTFQPSTQAPSVTPIACLSVPAEIPLLCVGAPLSSLQFPYLSADGTEVIVPTGCHTLSIPVFFDGTSSAVLSITVVDAGGYTFTCGSSSYMAQTDSAVEHSFSLPSQSSGLWLVQIAISSNSSPFSLTRVVSNMPTLYHWHIYTPPANTILRSTPGGFNVPTSLSDNAHTQTIPVPSSQICSGSRANLSYAFVSCEGVLRTINTNSSLVVATSVDVGIIPVQFAPTAGLRLSSGFDTPTLYIHRVAYLVPPGSETDFGVPYKGLEYIAPVHFGEQVASFRTLWKVFKTARYYSLVPSAPPQGTQTRVDGPLVYAARTRVYNIGEDHDNELDYLTLDRLVFWSFGCVRGSMVSHFTAEFGDGLVRFRRGTDDTTSETSYQLRGFEQMHTSVQRSATIHWPYYAEERFLIPRDLSATHGTHPRMIKEIELSVANKDASTLTVREDTAIGEDFSLSFFIGCPALKFAFNKGTSDSAAGSAEVQHQDTTHLDSFAPYTSAPSLAGTQYSRPVIKDTHAPTILDTTLTDDNLFDRRLGNEPKERKGILHSLGLT